MLNALWEHHILVLLVVVLLVGGGLVYRLQARVNRVAAEYAQFRAAIEDFYPIAQDTESVERLFRTGWRAEHLTAMQELIVPGAAAPKRNAAISTLLHVQGNRRQDPTWRTPGATPWHQIAWMILDIHPETVARAGVVAHRTVTSLVNPTVARPLHMVYREWVDAFGEDLAPLACAAEVPADEATAVLDGTMSTEQLTLLAALCGHRLPVIPPAHLQPKKPSPMVTTVVMDAARTQPPCRVRAW
jgi:hypothetical protein